MFEKPIFSSSTVQQAYHKSATSMLNDSQYCISLRLLLLNLVLCLLAVDVNIDVIFVVESQSRPESWYRSRHQVGSCPWCNSAISTRRFLHCKLKVFNWIHSCGWHPRISKNHANLRSNEASSVLLDVFPPCDILLTASYQISLVTSPSIRLRRGKFTSSFQLYRLRLELPSRQSILVPMFECCRRQQSIQSRIISYFPNPQLRQFLTYSGVTTESWYFEWIQMRRLRIRETPISFIVHHHSNVLKLTKKKQMP